MGYFSGANNRDATQKAPYFTPGFLGKVRVCKCLWLEARDGKKAFIAECEVLETNMPEEHPVGTRRSWYQNMTERDTGLSACILFLYATQGIDKDKHLDKVAKIKPMQEQMLEAAVDEKQNALAGATVGLETSNIVTKKKKENFTVHRFFAV